MDDGTHTCRCVYPGNGSMVPNTMRTGIRQREDAPDCEARGMGLAKPASLIIIKCIDVIICDIVVVTLAVNEHFGYLLLASIPRVLTVYL